MFHTINMAFYPRPHYSSGSTQEAYEIIQMGYPILLTATCEPIV
jgi:hypothetical protein